MAQWDIEAARAATKDPSSLQTGAPNPLDLTASEDFNLDPVQVQAAAMMVAKAKQAMQYLKNALSGLKGGGLKPSAPKQEPQGFSQPVEGGLDSNQAPQGGVPEWLQPGSSMMESDRKAMEGLDHPGSMPR